MPKNKLWLAAVVVFAGIGICAAQEKGAALSDLGKGVKAAPSAPKVTAAPAVKPLSGPAAEAAELIKELFLKVKPGSTSDSSDYYNVSDIKIAHDYVYEDSPEMRDFVNRREKIFWKDTQGAIAALDADTDYHKWTQPEEVIPNLLNYLSASAENKGKCERLKKILYEKVSNVYNHGYVDNGAEVEGGELFIFYFADSFAYKPMPILAVEIIYADM